MRQTKNAARARYTNAQKCGSIAPANETPNSDLRRLTRDCKLIYRPAAWPFEIVSAIGYAVQTECFTDEGDTLGSYYICGRYLKSLDGDTEDPCGARLFETPEDALEFIAKRGDRFEVKEDGITYPRVLKVRFSCIVEGVAFEPVLREVKDGEKVEGVA